MDIVKLGKEYKESVIAINQLTIDNLTDSSYYIPFTEEEINLAFDESHEVILYGVIEEGKLVAVSGLFFNASDLSDELKALGIKQSDVVEIGGCMTIPESRNKGYMLALNKELVSIARQKGFHFLIATAHPDNISSNKSLMNLGMRKVKEFYRHEDYLRNLYLMQL